MKTLWTQNNQPPLKKKWRIKIAQLGPKLQSTIQVLAEHLYSLFYTPPPTHHLLFLLPLVNTTVNVNYLGSYLPYFTNLVSNPISSILQMLPTGVTSYPPPPSSPSATVSSSCLSSAAPIILPPALNPPPPYIDKGRQLDLLSAKKQLDRSF